MSELAIDSKAAREITNDIFGCNLDGVRKGGLVDCKSEEEFHSVLNEVNKRWRTLHHNTKHFLSYLVNGPADVIKHSVRADIRSMCGLGFPPMAYSQNANKCLNTSRYVKENARGYEDETISLVEVVKNISSVVKRQFDEEFLAVIGKGTYRLIERFQFLREMKMRIIECLKLRKTK